MVHARAKLTRFARYSWAVLAYNFLVIGWGAFVRASGSGAGCGSHWPMCNGEVLPRPKTVEMLVEFTHRATSGLALILVVILALAARKLFPKGDAVRRCATLSVVFMLTEALIGAGLVLFELVAHDASMKRGFSICLHLANTFVLLGFLTLTAYWASGARRLKERPAAGLIALLASALVGTLFVATSGAVAALGDTLFPARSLADGFAADVMPTAHIFLRLRALHPLLALALGIYMVLLSATVRALRPSAGVCQGARWLTSLVVVQFAAGIANLLLLAPIAMQVVHLVLADAVWVALVILSANALATPRPREVEGVVALMR